MNNDEIEVLLKELNDLLTQVNQLSAEEQKGGPGSGRKPEGGSNQDDTRIVVGEGKPSRISEGGATSGPPTVSTTEPRPIKEIKRDLEQAREAARAADQALKDKPQDQASRNAAGRARQRVRELEREGRAAVAHARSKPKKQ